VTTRFLTLIRHAKSAWNSPAPSDFERPLNKRGRHDAPRMGQELNEFGIRFDRVLCSSAVRARETLSGLRQGMEIQDEAVSYLKELYLASDTTMSDLVASQQNDIHSIALIAHNPGMEDFAAMLSGGEVNRMPTCCVVRFSFSSTGKGWAECLSNERQVELIRLARELV
jgi:phosphohistidine phosphatase